MSTHEKLWKDMLLEGSVAQDNRSSIELFDFGKALEMERREVELRKETQKVAQLSSRLARAMSKIFELKAIIKKTEEQQEGHKGKFIKEGYMLYDRFLQKALPKFDKCTNWNIHGPELQQCVEHIRKEEIKAMQACCSSLEDHASDEEEDGDEEDEADNIG